MRFLIPLALLLGSAHAHPATERFIPIGKSPGLSGKLTYLGRIGAVNRSQRAIRDRTRKWTATVTARTRIWIDRSARGLPTRAGTFADLKHGRLVEVRYEGARKRSSGPAVWIKVRAP